MLLFPSSIIPLNITSFHFLIVVFYNDAKRNKRVHLLLFWTNRSFLSLVIYSIEFISLNKERRILTELFTITYGIENLIIAILRTVLLLMSPLHSQRWFMKESFTPSLLLPWSTLSPISTQLDLADRQLSSSQKTNRTNTTSHTQACIPFQSPCSDSSYPLFSPTVVSPIPD